MAQEEQHNEYKPYPSGLPFSEHLAVNLEYVRNEVFEKEMASVIIIDGNPGVGKTTLAVHCSDFLQRKQININTQIAQGGKEFSNVLEYCSRKNLPVCVYDEAGDFNRRGAITKFNKLINQIFEKFRAFKVIVIICIPYVGSLDDELLHKGIVKLFIHCHKKNLKKGTTRSGVYGIRALYLLKDRMKKVIIKPMAYSYVTPNEWVFSRNLDPQRAKELSELSTKSKKKGLFNTDLDLQGLTTKRDFRLETGCGKNRLDDLLYKYKIRPVRSAKGINYYDRGLMNKLKEEIKRRDRVGKAKKVRI